MREFLSHDADNLGLDMAYFFELTPTTYFEHTGIDSFLRHPNNVGRENRPHGILGAMCLCVIREPNPCRKSGQPYSAEEIDYFWSRLTARIDEIPTKYRRAVQRREPSQKFQRVIMNLVDQGKVLTATGQLRMGPRIARGTTPYSKGSPLTARSWPSGSSGGQATGWSTSFTTK